MHTSLYVDNYIYYAFLMSANTKGDSVDHPNLLCFNCFFLVICCIYIGGILGCVWFLWQIWSDLAERETEVRNVFG